MKIFFLQGKQYWRGEGTVKEEKEKKITQDA